MSQFTAIPAPSLTQTSVQPSSGSGSVGSASGGAYGDGITSGGDFAVQLQRASDGVDSSPHAIGQVQTQDQNLNQQAVAPPGQPPPDPYPENFQSSPQLMPRKVAIKQPNAGSQNLDPKAKEATAAESRAETSTQTATQQASRKSVRASLAPAKPSGASASKSTTPGQSSADVTPANFGLVVASLTPLAGVQESATSGKTAETETPIAGSVNASPKTSQVSAEGLKGSDVGKTTQTDSAVHDPAAANLAETAGPDASAPNPSSGDQVPLSALTPGGAEVTAQTVANSIALPTAPILNAAVMRIQDPDQPVTTAPTGNRGAKATVASAGVSKTGADTAKAAVATSSQADSAGKSALTDREPGAESGNAESVGGKPSSQKVAATATSPSAPSTNGAGSAASVEAKVSSSAAPLAVQFKADAGSGTSTIDRNHLVSEVATRLQNLATSRSSEGVTVRIEPPNMGSVTLVVRTATSGIQANIFASNDQVRDALQQTQSDLGQALAQRGMQVSAINVSSAAAESAGRGNPHASAGQNPQAQNTGAQSTGAQSTGAQNATGHAGTGHRGMGADGFQQGSNQPGAQNARNRHIASAGTLESGSTITESSASARAGGIDVWI